MELGIIFVQTEVFYVQTWVETRFQNAEQEIVDD